MKEKWKLAYIDTAFRFAELSSAIKLKVGCIIVKDNRIISIGYNGTPSGWDNTCEYKEFVGFNEQISYDDMVNKGFIAGVAGWSRLVTRPQVMHAEENAILKLAKSQESGAGSSLFCTHAPCIQCAKMIYGSGVSEVYYKHQYRSDSGIEFLHKCDIKVEKV